MHSIHLPRPLVGVLALTMALFAFGGTTVAEARSSTAQRSVIASNDLGHATSSFTGTTLDGRAVTGKFVPYRFVVRNGRILAQGTLRGTIAGKAGVSRALHFSKPATDRIKRIDGLLWKDALAGRNARSASARAAVRCDILNLVLGPLDLNILGLEVHLNRVLLDIVAVTGAGNLLGNLLCAVAGLLDGGLAGLLTQVQSLLNLILGALNLGPLPV